MAASNYAERKAELEKEFAELEIKLDETRRSARPDANPELAPEFRQTLARLQKIQIELDFLERDKNASGETVETETPIVETNNAGTNSVKIELGDETFVFNGSPEDCLLVGEIVAAVRADMRGKFDYIVRLSAKELAKIQRELDVLREKKGSAETLTFKADGKTLEFRGTPEDCEIVREISTAVYRDGLRDGGGKIDGLETAKFYAAGGLEFHGTKIACDAVRKIVEKNTEFVAATVDAAKNATVKKLVEFCLTFKRAPKSIDPFGFSASVPSILAKYALAIFADSERERNDAYDALDADLTAYSAELRAALGGDANDETNGEDVPRPVAVAEAATETDV